VQGFKAAGIASLSQFVDPDGFSLLAIGMPALAINGKFASRFRLEYYIGNPLNLVNSIAWPQMEGA
jgi:hypothetical protein